MNNGFGNGSNLCGDISQLVAKMPKNIHQKTNFELLMFFGFGNAQYQIKAGLKIYIYIDIIDIA